MRPPEKLVILSENVFIILKRETEYKFLLTVL